MSPRVLIADPHGAMRARIRSLVEKSGWQVVGEAADGQECVAKVLSLTPDLIILELSMPVKNGPQAVAEIRQLRPSAKLLMTTIHDSDVVREEVLRAGADGFAIKSSSAAELLSEARRLLGIGD